jgi:hypothetical protein
VDKKGFEGSLPQLRAFYQKYACLIPKFPFIMNCLYPSFAPHLNAKHVQNMS